MSSIEREDRQSINRTKPGESVDSKLESLRQAHPSLFLSPSSSQDVLITVCQPLNNLFPAGGIPFGNLFEITGSHSCGKTALLIHLLASAPNHLQPVYIDASGTFYPSSIHAAGISGDLMGFVCCSSATEAALTTEQLMDDGSVGVIACDLTGNKQALSTTLIHRLRMTILKKQGLVFFLTDTGSEILPPSMMSVQLTVTRNGDHQLTVAVTKSRLMPVGKTAEVILQ
jgi:hypothetical protein